MLKSNQPISAAYRRPRLANTIHRKVVARPDVVKVQMKSSKTQTASAQQTTQTQSRQVTQEQLKQAMQAQSSRVTAAQQQAAAARAAQQQAPVVRQTAQEIKQEAIQKALNAAAKTPAKNEKDNHVHFGFKRVLLALVCASAAVFAIVYFVNLNAPNVPLKVAAMQTGIDASYPSYVPRDFSLSDITSEDGKITLNFKNNTTGDAFSLVEERSSWDSNALLNNYVRDEYGDDYITMREQGLTIYISNSNATWTNGGIIYKIKTLSGTLTKKQLKSIAVSL